MSHAFGSQWQEDDWYSDAIASDICSFRNKYPKATVEDAIETFAKSWSETGIRHHWPDEKG